MVYDFYEKCLIRMPLFPLSELKHINDIEHILSIKSFEEAIYIASPSLYREAYIDKDRSEKTILSIIKYFVRACTRCTPYGLFAGCDMVLMGEDSGVEIKTYESYKTYSRIDMEYLCGFIRLMGQDVNIREKLSYHLNTSLYNIGDRIRYIEYKIVNKRRKYSFSEVKNSEYLNVIICGLFEKSRTIRELTDLIVSTDISYLEAKEFVNDLIDEQILISDLDPSTVGEDFIFQLNNNLKKLNLSSEFITFLIQLLEQCDSKPIGQRIGHYIEINNHLSKIRASEGDNRLHVDCLIPIERGSIGKPIRNAILKGIEVLKKITPRGENKLLAEFKKDFYDRYEEQEIPLSVALDPQTGVRFGRWHETKGDINPLIDGLPIPISIESQQSIIMDAFTSVLISKYEEAIKSDSYSIHIKEDDLKSFETIKDDSLPEELHIMVTILSRDSDAETVMSMNNAIGGSGASLISRFTYLGDNIQGIVDEITCFERDHYSDKIVAEIMHLPEDRVGNIQMHPKSLEYGISYLSNPMWSEPVSKIISINDIMISVPNGNKIVLRSKKYGKEIIPILNTAHNFSKGLPIYCFLSNLRQQNNKSLFFNWGNYFDTKQFLPRVMYRNIVLSPAKWTFSISDIPQQGKDKFDNFYTRILDWKEQHKLPNLVQITEGDNKLLIDFRERLLVKTMLNEVKRKKIIFMEEFLFANSEQNLVTRNDECYTNELIVCLKKQRMP